HVLDGFPAQASLQDFNQPHQLDRLVIADVVNSVRSVAAVLAGIRTRRTGGNLEYPGDNVINVGKIALHFAMIEDIDRFAFENGARKQVDCHIRTPPRTVYRKKA